MKLPLLLCAAGALALSATLSQAAEDFYVGTYTKFFGSHGIYHFQLDETTGKVSKGQLAIATSNPSFLVIHPNHRWLYAANEGKDGAVSAFAMTPGGRLQFLGQESSKGAGPCHVALDARHRFVFVANYDSGSVAAFPIESNGALGAATGFDQHHGTSVNHDRQQGPHAHSIYADPANRFVYSCDLGNDRVEGYRFDAAKGTLTPSKSATARIAPGSGPRHLVLHPRGFVYVINEMGNTLAVLRRDASTGALHHLQTATTLPAGDTKPNTTGEIALHPNGKFLYASNRGDDSIAVFAIAANGHITPVERISTGGKTPRNFSFDPSGRWLLAANQATNDIFVFQVNARTGKLTPTGQRVSLGAPVCVAFVQP